jgi:hypothetical protein
MAMAAVIKGATVYVPLSVDRKVMSSVMRTHAFEHITSRFVPGEEIAGLLTAKGITLTGTRTLSSGNNSVRQGAMTILALTPSEAAAGVLGNVVITGNSFDQVGNGVYAYGNITSNANGGSVTFRSNNNINQTGTISMVANTSGHGSAITYDVSTGNKTSSIATTNSAIAAGSTSGIDYNMFASGAALNPGLIEAGRVEGLARLAVILFAGDGAG